VSPWAKAARTRKRNARARERAARERSARARRAALIRWYGSEAKAEKAQAKKKKSTAKRVVHKKKVVAKSDKKPKKRPGPKPKTKNEAALAADNARLRRRLRKEEKKRQFDSARIRSIKQKLTKAGDIKGLERFGAEFGFPPRMRHESDLKYAKRIVRQILGENVYTVEAAIEYYRAISDGTGVPQRQVFSLFMSPKVA
jgi:hypothetical protein